MKKTLTAPCSLRKGRTFLHEHRLGIEHIQKGLALMDGIKFVVPNTCRDEVVEMPNLFMPPFELKPIEGWK